MKTRVSLVSNSSSASFIVNWNELDSKGNPSKTYLSDREVSELKAHGFQPTHLSHPSVIDVVHNDPRYYNIYKSKRKYYCQENLFKHVYCNEDDIISLLIQNNISFVASIHYGHEFAVFHNICDRIFFYRNFGMEVETYYQKKFHTDIMRIWNGGSDTKPIEVARSISVDDYLNERRRLYDHED